MANVSVIQRHAHLAGAVKLEFVNGREGKIAKAVLTAISNTRRGSGDSREEESTAIQWTLWGKQAESLSEYLVKGKQVYAGPLKDRDGILNPEHIAENYWQLHCQPRDAWTFELDLRPYMEAW